MQFQRPFPSTGILFLAFVLPSQAVILDRAVTLAGQPASCAEFLNNPPAAIATFPSTAQFVALAFSVGGQRAGDVAAVDYITPSGQVYGPASGPWEPLTASDESYSHVCYFDQALTIAGTAVASTPGLWSAKILYNGVLLTTLTFTIATTGNGGSTAGNLLQNGDAESGPANGFSGQPAIPGWTSDGKLAVVAYNDPGGDLTSTSPGPPDRRANYFAGGAANAFSRMSQTIDLSGSASAIDGGNQPYTLAGWLGGYANQDDHAVLRVTFLSASGATLGAAGVGPVLSVDRNGNSALLERTTTGKVPSGARSAVIGLECTRVSGSDNDGLADNLYFGLTAGAGACTYSLNPATQATGPAASSGTVSVTASSGCGWTAVSNVAWIAISAGSSGSGNGTVLYGVAANTAGSRTGTMTIAGQTFTVTQDAAATSCTYAIQPASSDAPAGGGNGSVSVTAGSGCAWQASSNTGWIAISSGAKGSGDGTVSYAVAANTAAAARNGTIAIAGLSFAVNQAGVAPQQDPPTIDAIVNTADYTPNLAPGSLVAILGTNLAAGPVQAQTTPLPTTLGGTTAEWTTETAWAPLPLFSVAAGQINAQLPFGLEGRTVQVRVRNDGGTSATVASAVQAVAPRLLTRTMVGSGEGLLIDSVDYKPVSAAVPARGNDYITLYLTGLGAVTGSAAAGNPGGDNAGNGPWNAATADVLVTIGGTQAQVRWAGLTPGLVGLYQVDLQVDPATPLGMQPIVVTANAIASQDNVTVGVADLATMLGEGAVTAASGGAVSANGVVVTVPPGAVLKDTVVRISRIAGRAPQQNQVSDVYVIRGLPDGLAAPIQITLPTSSPVDPTQTLVATRQLWGAGDFAQPLADGNGPSAASLHPMEVTAVVSEVTVTLPPALEPPVDLNDSEIETLVLQNYPGALCPGGRFELFLPTAQPFHGHFDKICGWLNDARDKLVSLGLVFGLDRRRWPFRAVYVPFDPGSQRWGEHVPGANGDINYDSIRLNQDMVSAAIQNGQNWEDELAATIGHELFHFVQNSYDSRLRLVVAKTAHRDLWFEEALSTWFEGVMLGQGDYISRSVRNGDWQFGFQHGLQYSPSGCTWASLRAANQMVFTGDPCTDPQNMGYGASLLLRNIAAGPKGGQALVDAMVHALHLGDQTAAQALNVITGGLDAYWTNLARSLLEGTYGSAPNWPDPRDLMGMKKSFQFKPGSTSSDGRSAVDSWEAQDLSMRLDKISFADPLPAGSKVLVTVGVKSGLDAAQPDPNVTAYLYQYKNDQGRFDLVATFTDAHSMEDAGNLAATKAYFLLLVVQNRCRAGCTGALLVPIAFTLNTNRLLETRWLHAGVSGDSTDLIYDDGHPTIQKEQVAWSGDTFTQSWTRSAKDTNGVQYVFEGSASGTASPAHDMLLEFTCRASQKNYSGPYAPSANQVITEIALVNVPFGQAGQAGGALTFGISGGDLSANVKVAKSTQIYGWDGNNPTIQEHPLNVIRGVTVSFGIPPP